MLQYWPLDPDRHAIRTKNLHTSRNTHIIPNNRYNQYTVDNIGDVLQYFRRTNILRLLVFLQNILMLAADRINKSDFYGRYGTVNYHSNLNIYIYIVIKDFPG